MWYTAGCPEGARGVDVLRLFFRRLSWVLALLAALVVLSWCTGRLLTDRTVLTQYLFWPPALAYGLVSVLLLSFSWLLALMGQPYLPTSFAPDADKPVEFMRLPRAARGTRRAVGLACTAMIVHAVVVEARGVRWLHPPTAPNTQLRLVFWNAATAFMDDYADKIATVNPSIVCIANPAAYCKWEVIREAVGGDKSDAQRYGRLACFGPWPILRWGGTSLEIQGAKTRYFDGKPSIDRGQAMFVEFDATETFGRPIVVWVIDIPSDIALSRQTMLKQAAAAINGFSGPVMIRGKSGLDQEVDSPKGFPAPDIIAGDFNTPRGSASLSHVSGTLVHAYDQAGYGPEPTWHREYPLVAIDHVFTGGPVRAAGYSSVDVGAGKHRMQIVDLASVAAGSAR
ncbi:MAG: endonuclease/exonuclease/phosphatase family protein [Phycisphaerales bacterium]